MGRSIPRVCQGQDRGREGPWAAAFPVFSCLTVEVMWPAASCSCHIPFPTIPWGQNITYLPYVAFARCFAAATRQVTTKTHMMEAEEIRMQKLHPEIIVSIVNMMSLLRYSSHQRNSALVCRMTCVRSIVSKTDSINKNLNRLPD